MTTDQVNKSHEADATGEGGGVEKGSSQPADTGGAGGVTRAGTKEDIRSDEAPQPAPEQKPPTKLRDGT